MGAGKTTFYEAHLKEAFPIVVPPIRHQRDAMLRERRSFTVEDLNVDSNLLESARQAGYATKVFFLHGGPQFERRAHRGSNDPRWAIGAAGSGAGLV